ncbi:MAG: hypothetical protein J6N76_03310 [Lachnospiraceae bacterium]|nr:hypothetical protein [Lachnospiraceae bacterium]
MTSVHLACPAYKKAYAPVQDKIGGSQVDISRVLGAVLKPVKFNEDWEPISKEDKEAHEWNMKFFVKLNTQILGPMLSPEEEENIKKAEAKLQNGLAVFDDEVEFEEGKKTGIYKPTRQKAWYNENTKRWVIDFTKEDYNKVKEVKKLNEVKENNLPELMKIMEESYEENFAKNRIELPTPELLEQELIEPLKKGEPLNSPTMEGFLKDKEKYAKIAALSLAYEGPLKYLDFFKEKKDEYDKKYGGYVNSLAKLITLVDMYCSAKYRVKADAGHNAIFNNVGGMLFATGRYEGGQGLINEYKETYNKYVGNAT